MATENILQTIETDIEAKLGPIATLVQSDVKVGWNVISKVWFSVTPAMWTALIPLIEKALIDVVTKDYGDLLDSVVQQAEVLGMTDIQNLSEDVLTAIIAAWRLP